MKLLKNFMRPYWGKAILGMGTKLLEALLELLLPLFMARIIDVGIHNGDVGYIFQMAGWMLLTIVVGLISAVLGQYCAATVAQGLGKDMRDDLVKKVQTFSYREIDQFGTAALSNRVTSDVNQVVTAVNMFIRLMLRAPFLCIGALLMSFYINPQMALIFAILTPVFALILYWISHKTVPLYQKVQRQLDRFGSLLRENLSGVRVIRAFVRQKQEEERAFFAANDLESRAIHVTNISALLNPLTTVAVNFGVIAILYFGARQINSGFMLQGDMVALINYITQILLALTLAANLMVLFSKASASARRIQEIRTVEPSDQDVKNVSESIENAPVLAFDHVSFSFGESRDEREKTLSNICFSLSKGQTLGVVGMTGSGKSALANLVPRFYRAQEGRVLFCGTNVETWSQKALRLEMGIVPQKSTLFSGTVRQNLQFSVPEANDTQMKKAIEDAQATFIFQTQQGLDTPLYEGGKNLSGGQRQRLCIARALLRNPRLLILDDSFSALDASTAEKVMQTLKQGVANGSILLVSQKISQVQTADQILVLDEGRQVGLGTHQALLEDCKPYRELYQSQQPKEVAG